jgi:hypothetical protein
LLEWPGRKTRPENEVGTKLVENAVNFSTLGKIRLLANERLLKQPGIRFGLVAFFLRGYFIKMVEYPNPHNYFLSGVQLIQVKSSTEGQQLKTQKLRTSSPTGKPRHKFVFLFFITMKNF